MKRSARHGGVLAGALLLGGGAAVAACGALIDASDYAVEDAGSDATAREAGTADRATRDGGAADAHAESAPVDATASAADAAPVGAEGSVADAARVCVPSDVSGFVPVWHPPNAPQLACSSTDLDSFFTNCIDTSATTQSCVAFSQAHPACFACVSSHEADPMWGPVVQSSAVVLDFANTGGCLALETGDVSATGCGALKEIADSCGRLACAKPSCPSATQADLGVINACITSVNDGGCAPYVRAAANCTAALAADGGAATQAEQLCNQGSYPSINDYYRALADLFCSSASAPQPICGQGLPTGQATFQQMVRACVLSVSCEPLRFPRNIGSCITENFLNSNGLYACLSTIQDCGGYYQCGGTRIATAAECPANGPAVHCDRANNLAIDCNRLAVRNCTKFGGTCNTFVDPATGAPSVDCQVVTSCAPQDGQLHCTPDGQTIYMCEGDAGFGEQCPLINATCSQFGDGGPGCYLDGVTCSVPGDTCSPGGTLTHCASLSLRESEVSDCTAAGLSCFTPGDGGAGACLAPGCPSLATCPVESCGVDGKTLTVCVGGAPLTIDCTSYGFTSCGSFTTPSGTVYGFCQ